MSSHEVRFTTEQALAVGQKVELTVSWPVLLEQTCRLKLVISGHVIRNETHGAAVRIDRYEFRTRAPSPLVAGAV